VGRVPRFQRGPAHVGNIADVLRLGENAMSQTFYLIYALFFVGLLGWGGAAYARSHRAGTLLLAMLAGGLLYDNGVLALGGMLGKGALLYALSLARFGLYLLLLPWMGYAVYEQLRAAGVRWARRRWSRGAALGLSAVISLVGALTRLPGLRLEPAVMDGVTRYVDVGPSSSPWVSLASLLVVATLGVFYGVKKKWPWTSLAALLLLGAQAIRDPAMSRLLGSALEIVLVSVLLLAETRLPVRWRKRHHHRTTLESEAAETPLEEPTVVILPLHPN
jgi:hypothetical protein